MDIDLKSSKRWLSTSDVVDMVGEMSDKIEELESENEKLRDEIINLESEINDHVNECEELKARIREFEEA